MAEDATKTLHLYIDQQKKCKLNKKEHAMPLTDIQKNEHATTVNSKTITFSNFLKILTFKGVKCLQKCRFDGCSISK